MKLSNDFLLILEFNLFVVPWCFMIFDLIESQHDVSTFDHMALWVIVSIRQVLNDLHDHRGNRLVRADAFPYIWLN